MVASNQTEKFRARGQKGGRATWRSAALLELAGFAEIEPLHPVREVWHLVAHTAQHPGLMLVGVFAIPPDPRSPRLGLPGGYHPGTRRLIHCWKADAPLPEAMSL